MIEPFIRKAKVGGLNDCWEWQGTRNGQGYGFHYFEGRTEGAHRVSHKLFHGPIPKGMETMHSCDNRICVNPAHLSYGTKFDNMRDCAAKKRNWQQKKTHCPQGHAYENNFYLETQHGLKRRRCKKCHKAKVDRLRKRKQNSDRSGTR